MMSHKFEQEKELTHQLIAEGRSNAYICNYHALCNLNLQVSLRLPTLLSPLSWCFHQSCVIAKDKLLNFYARHIVL